jgi:hypothetical protein
MRTSPGLELHARRGRGRHSLAALMFAVAMTASLGCAKRVTSVDASFDRVEGVPSSSQMVIYADTPSTSFLYHDEAPNGPSVGDTLLATFTTYQTGPGTVQGMIFDYTPANRFEIYRREANGGFLKLQDFDTPETKQWVSSQADLFIFTDPRPVSSATGTYVGRGVIGDVVSPGSPLTNVAQASFVAVDTVQYTGDRTPSDSLFTLSWTAVPAASGYWLQVYQFRSDVRSLEERIRSGIPAPIFGTKATDFLVAYVPAPATSYKIGDPGPPGSHILTTRTPLFEGTYFARVSAVDAAGRLLATTNLTGDFAIQLFVDQTFLAYPLGAVVVFPERTGPSPRAAPGAVAATLPAPEEWGPDARIVPRAALRLPRR